MSVRVGGAFVWVPGGQREQVGKDPKLAFV